MRWQVMKGDTPTTEAAYDDGVLGAGPGDPEFTTALIEAHVQGLGAAADSYNYVGTSGA